jgi:hypothetical protein
MMTPSDYLRALEVFAALAVILLFGSAVRRVVDCWRWRMAQRPRPARRFR